VSVGIATALRLTIDPYVVGVQFITFAPVIVITTLISGFGAGLFCVVLTTAATAFFVLPPRFSFYVVNEAEVVDLLLFAPVASVCVMLIAQMRSAIEREQAELAWRASKDRLQLCLDAAQLGWWRYDPSCRLVTGDTRFKEIFDVTADEMPVEELKKLVHPEDAERFLADSEASIDPAERRSPHEYRVQRRDGKVRWVEVRWLACFERTGHERRPLSFIGTVQDITERKEREEREHLLMREITHRARNLLNLVQVIARQTAVHQSEDFVERFAERIQALSANQNVLIRNEWHGVEIEDLVRAHLALFADLIGSRIGLHGPKLRLNAAAAQAIGLAMHELATNAGKHGALSMDKGHVNVYWETDGDTLTMSWTERGGPPVSPPGRRGFGSVVMQEMVEHSVDGSVVLDYAPSGLTWRLTCPAANALEPVPNFCGPRAEALASPGKEPAGQQP
jgi:PAS domain S-box-containing protein